MGGVRFSVPLTDAMRREVHLNRHFTAITFSRNSLPGFFVLRGKELRPLLPSPFSPRSGKPVAYLDRDSSGCFHVYGFNGEHLGWFSRGIARDQSGDGACVVKEVLSSTDIEPIKSIKEIKPIKSIREIAPIRPISLGHGLRLHAGSSCRRARPNTS